MRRCVEEDDVCEEEFLQVVIDGFVEGLDREVSEEVGSFEFHVHEEALDGAEGIVDREVEFDGCDDEELVGNDEFQHLLPSALKDSHELVNGQIVLLNLTGHEDAGRADSGMQEGLENETAYS